MEFVKVESAIAVADALVRSTRPAGVPPRRLRPGDLRPGAAVTVRDGREDAIPCGTFAATVEGVYRRFATLRTQHGFRTTLHLHDLQIGEVEVYAAS